MPPEWKHATVISIVNPGKDASKPESYRPLSLTSCLCKVMERMINTRLVEYLEMRNILDKVQCGSRKGRSTNDYLARLEAGIRTAFSFCSSVFRSRESI